MSFQRPITSEVTVSQMTAVILLTLHVEIGFVSANPAIASMRYPEHVAKVSRYEPCQTNVHGALVTKLDINVPYNLKPKINRIYKKA